jgi:hypothetical protein
MASDYKDCVFDMELAFIAALGFKHLHSLKYVSDNLSLHAYHELTHGVEKPLLNLFYDRPLDARSSRALHPMKGRR